MKLLASLFGPPEKASIQLAAVNSKQPAVAEDLTEYRALAERVGFLGVETALAKQQEQQRQDQFARFLFENNIQVFNPAAVSKYMDRITPSTHKWTWRPVNSDRYNEARLYQKLIPIPVLLTMEKIVQAYPNAYFEITDIREMPKGDPFLRVAESFGREYFIIERWDEPAFRNE